MILFLRTLSTGLSVKIKKNPKVNFMILQSFHLTYFIVEPQGTRTKLKLRKVSVTGPPS